ncbi:MAG: VOC family protein [Neomegalonema sp.]|nr:VOC family protein [Neomegalonema sp.]
MPDPAQNASEPAPRPDPRHNRIDYIEFAVSDIARAKAFYGSVFGWRFTDYGPEYCELADGRLTGGFHTQSAPKPGGPLIVLYAQDLTAAQAAVTRAGGIITREIFAFPGGERFEFTDPDGYALAVWNEGRAA